MRYKCIWCLKEYETDDYELGVVVECCHWARIVKVVEKGEVKFVLLAEEDPD